MLRGVQREQIKPNSSFFLSITELLYVQGKCKKEKLSFYVFLSSCQKASKTVVLFEYAKHTFHLTRSVHTEKRASFACQSLQHLRAVFIQNLIHSYRSIPILGTMTFVSVRASSAFVIAVISRGYDVTVLGCLLTLPYEIQFSAIGTRHIRPS